MSKKYFENKSLKLHFFQGWDQSEGKCESQDPHHSEYFLPEQDFPREITPALVEAPFIL